MERNQFAGCGGKVFAKVIQQHLQAVVEEVVADSQCGFRYNRSIDMIFCVCQLIEKTIEHDTKAFILFIDLKNAYDLVPRATMWQIFAKYGVPDVVICLIRSLHDNMLAGISLGVFS